ncbi:GTP cyclohydrolase II [Malassezia nana]|uniref:GTP cyclohydrolase II n=1 Tax=Malassezia nana TaxID=180528 RepID=A0AAF0EMU7_9BASI|nr:GTP cyclohydrolase II [Malassezia nana]
MSATLGDTYHHRVEQADLDMLDMLTSLPAPASPLKMDAPPHHRAFDTVAALRRPPIDPIVLAASLSSGPQVTRHHFHHTFADPESARMSGHSQQMPVSERLRQTHKTAASTLRDAAEADMERRAILHSKQAPRSVRLQREKEEKARIQAAAVPPPAPASASAPALTPAVAVAPAPATSTVLQREYMPTTRPSVPLEVRCCARTRVPTPHGEVFCHLYRNNHDNKEHMALVVDPAQNDPVVQAHQAQGSLRRSRLIRSRTLDAVWSDKETTMERLVRGAYVDRLSETHQVASVPEKVATYDGNDPSTPPPLVRIHSECYTGETIGSQRCDCGEQLDEALRLISTSTSQADDGTMVAPRGVVVYMRQEGRGIGLLDKLMAYNLQDMGHDTVSANVLLGHLPDARRYDISSAILRDLGIDTCRLLTNNPEKMQAMEEEGIHVVERVPMVPRMWRYHEHCSHKHGPQIRRSRRLARQAPRRSRPNSVISQALEGSLEHGSLGDDSDDAWNDEDAEASDESAHSFQSYTLRSTGATLIGASVTRGTDLEKYLRTKIERMGHLLQDPSMAPSPPPS